MPSDVETRLGATLAEISSRVTRRPGITLGFALALAFLALGFAATQLGVNSETDDLFDSELPFRQDRARLDAALPARNDNLLVVLDAPSRIAAADAASLLVERLEAEPDRFASSFAPGAGPYFEKHGLLFLRTDQLNDLADDLAGAQPFLAEIARDPSLRGLFGQLTRAIERGALDQGGFDLQRVLEGVAQAVVDAQRRQVDRQAFGELVLGGEEEGPVRRYVIVEPRPDYNDFVPGRASVGRLHEILQELDWEGEGPIRARVTGDLALKTEEFGLVKAQAATAGVVSFLLVGLILWSAQRSGRLMAATLSALLVGLIWTAGFAALAIGHLNIISVAFAVLFIGLGVDFGIHLTLRYREVRSEGGAHGHALQEAARSVGPSLVLCSITTAIGFYAFVPTDFLGVSELGVISGTGMLISLIASFTVLPAVLALGKGGAATRHRGFQFSLPLWPTRYPRAVCAGASLLAIAAATQLPSLHFDANPLRVRDPDAASVQTFFELLDGGDINPWSIDVLAPSLEEADALAERIGALPSVERTSTLSSYVPEGQAEKLALLEDVALFLGFAELSRAPASTLPEEEAALRAFRKALLRLETPTQGEARQEIAKHLGEVLDGFLADLNGTSADTLRVGLVQSVLDRVSRLEVALGSRGASVSDLPEVLHRRMVAEDGRALIEVYPKQSLNNDAVVAAFVAEVRSVAPSSTGAAVYMVEAASAIMEALQQAMLTAIVCIAALLLVLWRNLRDTALVLTPLLLAALLTAAAAVVFGIPINFADVIVVPLLLGIGVDSGIHLVHRFRVGAPSDGILDTSTSRAVFWSALTTIASFGSLGLASHQGLATLGQLLTLGVGMTLISNLIFLPALLTLSAGQKKGSS